MESGEKLLEPRNSEPCISNLLSIFDPLKSDNGKYIIPIEILDFVKAYITDSDGVNKLAVEITTRHADKGCSRDSIEQQFAWRIRLICAVESFLLSHWDESENGLSKADVIRLAEGTLAFFLADKEKRIISVTCFSSLLRTSRKESPIQFAVKSMVGCFTEFRRLKPLRNGFSPTLTVYFPSLTKQKCLILFGHCSSDISIVVYSPSSINKRFLKKSRMDGSEESLLVNS